MNTVRITVDNRTVIRVALALVALVLFYQFIAATKEVLTLIGVSFFLALALNAPVNYLSNRITRGSRGLATGIAYLLVVGLIGIFLYAAIPPLVHQTARFVDNVPQYIDQLETNDSALGRFVQRYDIESEVDNYLGQVADRLDLNTGTIFAGIGRAGSIVAKILTVLVLTFFMIIEGPYWGERLWEAVPASKRSRYKDLASRMHRVVTGYVNGQLLIALLGATTSLVAMLILNLPYPLPLAGLVGLCALIPLIGATIGSVLVIIVALFQSFYTALAMFIFFLVYQQIENTVIQPHVQARALEVSPLLVLIAALLGISMGGLLGGLVAIPLAACARLLFIDYYSRYRSNRAAAS